ncbi:MAG: hypothetical protein KC431_26790, partial [Myxococcales bacterium]|nr:hypothetical protein [Myxococcales bacterium]
FELIIRLCDEHEQGDRCRSLATVRGAGMVVEYRGLSGVAGLRPFHAILVCGLARQRAAPSDADAVIEQFLRDAEPPGHDTWHVTPALKDGWLRGSGQVFVRLWDSVLAALRQMLAPVVEVGVEGPERLRKRFPLGRRGRTGDKGPSAFHFREFDATLSAEAWRFTGTVEPELGGRPWRVQIGLHHLGEDGARVRELAIASFETEPKLPIERVAGAVAVEVPLGITRLTISGTSEEVATELLHTELGLRVHGELREPT